MNTYRIERVDGQFEVVVYERKWFREKRKVIDTLARLSLAEEIFVGAIGEAFARKLDRDRFDTVEASIDDCLPRKEEEHIYTAIVLQHGGPPLGRDMPISPNIHEIAEKMVGEKFTRIEQRLFLHRFMTWYARHNPDYEDPRLEAHHEEHYGRGYASATSAVAGHQITQSAMARAMRHVANIMTGRKY